MSDDLSLRLYPDLARLAKCKREERLYLVWTVAKAQGRIRDGIGHPALVKALVEALEWHPATVRKALADGEGIYWTTGEDRHGAGARVYLPNPDRLAMRLGRTDPSGEPLAFAGSHMIRLRLRELRDADGTVSTKAWKKALLGAQLPAKPSVLPRGLIAARTGVPASTQRRWEREGGIFHSDGHGIVPVHAQKVFVDWTALLGATGVNIVLHPQSPYANKGLFLFHTRVDGAPVDRLAREAPKTYQSDLKRVKRNLDRYRRKNPTYVIGRTRVGNHSPVVMYRDVEPKGKHRPRVWIAPTGHPRMKEALPMRPGVGLHDIIFGGLDC